MAEVIMIGRTGAYDRRRGSERPDYAVVEQEQPVYEQACLTRRGMAEAVADEIERQLRGRPIVADRRGIVSHLECMRIPGDETGDAAHFVPAMHGELFVGGGDHLALNAALGVFALRRVPLRD